MKSRNLYSTVQAIVNEGKASKIINHLRDKGLVNGGTVMMAQGTATSEILKFLELHRQRKEFLFMAVDRENEEAVMKELEEEFKFGKKTDAGIGFSIDIYATSWSPIGRQEEDVTSTYSRYEAVFVIVERGDAEDVVDIAHEAGAKGATILHGRGAGQAVIGDVFDMVIEPEKDIVLMLIQEENVENIIKTLSQELQIDEPGNGIIFAMDCNRTVGLA